MKERPMKSAQLSSKAKSCIDSPPRLAIVTCAAGSVNEGRERVPWLIGRKFVAGICAVRDFSVRVWNFLKELDREGSEIHRRIQATKEESFHSNYWFHIR
jgi:hypothetical protein